MGRLNAGSFSVLSRLKGIETAVFCYTTFNGRAFSVLSRLKGIETKSHLLLPCSSRLLSVCFPV